MANHQKRLFIGCIIALVATSFGFIVRAFLLNQWGVEFNLTETQKGNIQGAGLFPFAISIIFFSLIIDKIGYGPTMVFAWLGHVISAVITIKAKSYEGLYFGTLLFALANGAVEAVINPVTAALYPREKTHYLNILHAGWPGGLVVGGILAILMRTFFTDAPWQWQVGLVLIPTVLYGLMLAGQRFPVSERVAAGVSYKDMLREFGAGSCFIATFFLVLALKEILVALGADVELTGMPLLGVAAGVALAASIVFALTIGGFGRPMFVFLLVIMVLLATTELGTDSWIAALMTPVLKGFGENAGNWVLVYTSAIMFVLRFFAGPIVHRTSPLGLLAICAAVAAAGLFALSRAGDAAIAVFLAATLYGFGKTFFWPTTLGVVSEQFPKGGALTLNAIAGVGMISVGVLGGVFLGALQDKSLDVGLQQANPAIHTKLAKPAQKYLWIDYQPLDKSLIEALPETEKNQVEQVRKETSQKTLAQVAIFPAIMFACYVLLILYFKARGGYRPVELAQAPPAPVGAERY